MSRILRIHVAIATLASLAGCSTPRPTGAVARPSASVELPPAPTPEDASPPPSIETQSAALRVRQLSLVDDRPVAVPESDLTAHISGAFHKARAPVVGVSVLFQRGNDKAEVSWRIESGRLDAAWVEIAGRRWDDAANDYVDEVIDGWRVRLDSVDDQSAGGSPSAVTISIEPVAP
jgi:hypothetical protein